MAGLKCRLVLASASPRRRELLAQIGAEFDILPARGEEHITTARPEQAVLELSRQKAEEVAGYFAIPQMADGNSYPAANARQKQNLEPLQMEAGEEPSGAAFPEGPMVGKEGTEGFRTVGTERTVILGADTVVAFQGQVLGKPKDKEDAARMLKMLSGNTHSVFTGVTAILLENQKTVKSLSFFEETKVAMYPMAEEEIKDYVATGEPMDKAGAYGIQGKCAIFIKKIMGDYNNVVGLPVAALYQKLAKSGIDIL